MAKKEKDIPMPMQLGSVKKQPVGVRVVCGILKYLFLALIENNLSAFNFSIIDASSTGHITAIVCNFQNIRFIRYKIWTDYRVCSNGYSNVILRNGKLLQDYSSSA